MKYLLGGIGAAKLLPMMAGLNPAVAAPALLAYSMVEAVASIAVFNKIAGTGGRDGQVMAFALASAASAFATPFLMGLGPLGATLVSNAGRLILFNLISRKPGEKFSITGLPTVAALRSTLEGEDASSTATTESLPPDLLWAGAPAAGGGDLLELHERVRRRYEELLEERGYSDEALRRYASAKKSLDAAVAALIQE